MLFIIILNGFSLENKSRTEILIIRLLWTCSRTHITVLSRSPHGVAGIHVKFLNSKSLKGERGLPLKISYNLYVVATVNARFTILSRISFYNILFFGGFLQTSIFQHNTYIVLCSKFTFTRREIRPVWSSYRTRSSKRPLGV